MRKIIKLINNERMNQKISSSKAVDFPCDSSSNDYCSEVDNAICTVGSYDLCVKDYAGCTNHTTDYCASVYDYSACYTPGATDH